MQIGYASVSTKDQDLQLPFKALNQANCGKIFDDEDGIPAKDVTKNLGVSVPTLNRWLPVFERS
jgi:DNA invertase Pin-like site-specific DNA recombinase